MQVIRHGPDDLANTTRMAQFCANTEGLAKIIMKGHSSYYWLDDGEAAFKAGDTSVGRVEPQTAAPTPAPTLRPHDDPAFRERADILPRTIMNARPAEAQTLEQIATQMFAQLVDMAEVLENGITLKIDPEKPRAQRIIAVVRAAQAAGIREEEE